MGESFLGPEPKLTSPRPPHGARGGGERARPPFGEAARREVEPKTGWSEGRSPTLQKADRREAWGLRACFFLVVSLRFMLDDLSPLVLKCSPLLS